MPNKRHNKQVPGYMKGGRVKKMGGGMMQRRPLAKGTKPKNGNGKKKAFGMLSVKKGLDNNKNITFTDKIAGAKKS